MNIVNVGYDSTNYYVIADARPRLLVDVGWPGTLPKLQHQCRRAGVHLPDIPFLLTTHFHPDHAGLAQELKPFGLWLTILDTQTSSIPMLRAYMKPQHHYVEIDPADSVPLTLADSRPFLARLGIQGEIISTPGHSDDSITLILDEGAAFTGDLPRPSMAPDETGPIHHSWQKIRALRVHTIYPGHGPAWPLDLALT